MTDHRTALAGVCLVAALALVGCSGESDDDVASGAARSCSPGDGQALRALADDRSALPAANWVPVLATRDGFRTTLALLDQASRGFSGEDLQGVLAATTPGERDAALGRATSDVATGARGAGVVRLLVPEGTAAQAVGLYYRAALEQLGARVTIERTDLGAALTTTEGDDRAAAPVVLTGLSELADEVGADLPEGGDASAQVQAVATAALERGLALGSAAAATAAAQVLVPDALVTAASLVTLSDLATACDGAVLAVVGEDDAAAEAVATAYGFRVGPSVDDPAEAFGDGTDAVAVITVGP